MASGERRDQGHDAPLVIELTLSRGAPLTGTVGLSDQPGRTSFTGWLALMGVINDLRAGSIPR